LSISQVRKVELEDLLGREVVQLDSEGLHRLLTGKRVLVTGAGGSIGSELCAPDRALRPEARLVLFEQCRVRALQIEQEFAGGSPDVVDRLRRGRRQGRGRLTAAFAQASAGVVFHAAAYKHVPLMENENAWEAVRNNVLGTLRGRARGDGGTASRSSCWCPPTRR
jgi:FlaA1/EpsC-like NDP-sugar epimerase